MTETKPASKDADSQNSAPVDASGQILMPAQPYSQQTTSTLRADGQFSTFAPQANGQFSTLAPQPTDLHTMAAVPQVNGLYTTATLQGPGQYTAAAPQATDLYTTAAPQPTGLYAPAALEGAGQYTTAAPQATEQYPTQQSYPDLYTNFGPTVPMPHFGPGAYSEQPHQYLQQMRPKHHQEQQPALDNKVISLFLLPHQMAQHHMAQHQQLPYQTPYPAQPLVPQPPHFPPVFPHHHQYHQPHSHHYREHHQRDRVRYIAAVAAGYIDDPAPERSLQRGERRPPRPPAEIIQVQGPAGTAIFYRDSMKPEANPNDNNKKCNTLYVGNLPLDAHEDELKLLFSRQRGYTRMSFRCRRNSVLCFVEFANKDYASIVLFHLYGTYLHNSQRGGIRLSFSRNPLGRRSPEEGASASLHNPNDQLQDGVPRQTGLQKSQMATSFPPGVRLPPMAGPVHSVDPSAMAPGAGTSIWRSNHPTGTTNGNGYINSYTNGYNTGTDPTPRSSNDASPTDLPAGSPNGNGLGLAMSQMRGFAGANGGNKDNGHVLSSLLDNSTADHGTTSTWGNNGATNWGLSSGAGNVGPASSGTFRPGMSTAEQSHALKDVFERTNAQSAPYQMGSRATTARDSYYNGPYGISPENLVELYPAHERTSNGAAGRSSILSEDEDSSPSSLQSDGQTGDLMGELIGAIGPRLTISGQEPSAANGPGVIGSRMGTSQNTTAAAPGSSTQLPLPGLPGMSNIRNIWKKPDQSSGAKQ